MGNTSVRLDEIKGSKDDFEGSSLGVINGDDALLECPIFGHPKPTVIWKKNGEELVVI